MEKGGAKNETYTLLSAEGGRVKKVASHSHRCTPSGIARNGNTCHSGGSTFTSTVERGWGLTKRVELANEKDSGRTKKKVE